MNETIYDLAVVGAGIVGLAHALAARRLGARVIVIDQDAAANGASVRNFGFVTVTGQQKGECWQRARRSRDVWAEIAPRAGIAVEHAGLAVTAQREEAVPVLEAFLKTEMGEHCRFLSPAEILRDIPLLARPSLQGALWSPHELRVESRTAIPRLAAFLEKNGVLIKRNTKVTALNGKELATSDGIIRAQRVVAATNDDFLTLFARRIAPYRLTKCKLQMLRARLPGHMNLPGAVMSDLSLVRYLGYSELPEAKALKARLEIEQPRHLAHGIHLIAVQSEDGSLVIGDSHHYGATPDPFALDEVDGLILEEFEAVFGARPEITERWTGIYPSSPNRLALIDAPSETCRLVIVTSGTGASTAFAIAEEVITDLFGDNPAARPLPQ